MAGLLARNAAAVAVLLASSALVLGMDVSVTSSLSFDVADAKNRPVSKVITLLKDMLKQLEKEAEEDEAVYEKMACWCETNDKEKTKAIKEAEAKIAALEAKIEDLAALSVRLQTEIKNLEGEIFEYQGALEKATALRQKQTAEFNGEEKELLDSVAALKAAIVVLSKHHGGSSLLQVPASHLLGVATTLQHEMQKHDSLLRGVLTRSQRRMVAAFVQAPSDYFDASPTFKQAYAPQSGQVLGILKQMKETFESNLSASQKEELANQEAYEQLKASLEAQIAAANESREKKVQELADTDQAHADAKQDLEDTNAALSADQKYLMMLKEKCSMTDQEWEERQKTRAEEMSAVSKALAILSSDDAHDLFTKTFNPTLLQVEDAGHKSLRLQASQVLEAKAQEMDGPRLVALAYQIRLDAFTRVKKAIDDMIAKLLQEKENEVKHKDFCTDELNTNQLDTEKKTREKSGLETKIDGLHHHIAVLADEIKAHKTEIADMQLQMKRAGEDREIENKEFQLTVADQRATQKLLQAALAMLKSFYDKKAAALLQRRQEPVGPPPPEGFKAYKKNESASGVVGLIEQIIMDAKTMEAEAITAEEDAQTAYEDFVKGTNASIAAATKAIMDKSKVKAEAETDAAEADDSLDAAELELGRLSDYKTELHTSCDFVLKNFEYRQKARDEEIEALKQAKAILSGAKFDALLQSYGA